MTIPREEDLQGDLRSAMKSRSATTVAALRGALAAVKNARIAKSGGQALSDEEVIGILRREIKQRDEAIEYAEKAGRSDLVDQNRAERDVLARYLPQGVSVDELSAAIERHFDAGADSIGAFMSGLKEEFGARLDGRAASAAVRSFLAQRGES